jgi:hypothetical protein
VVTPADDRHPETNREEAIVTETYSAADVAEWADGLGRESERGLEDGAVSGEFPRRSRLAAAMAEVDHTPASLAAEVLLPVALIERLIETGEVPGADLQRQLEAIVPDPFPEHGELIEPSPNELSGDMAPASRHRDRSEPVPTRGEQEDRAQRRARHAAEVAQERERRRAKAQQRRAALKATDLPGISAKLRRLSERLGRE